jgi:RNase P subunit RPR2
MATIDYTDHPQCKKCHYPSFRRQIHGNGGPHYYNPYLTLTCNRCGYTLRMRLGPKTPREHPPTHMTD